MQTFIQALADYTVERVRQVLQLSDKQDEPCRLCGERVGDHSEEMLWNCSTGG